ncbi:hypothetical protein HYW31_00430 [Candidatus Berkelbacteria bacterium]|nr:hypothetical protein [Candidatus Berkelbacteria bacterium]
MKKCNRLAVVFVVCLVVVFLLGQPSVATAQTTTEQDPHVKLLERILAQTNNCLGVSKGEKNLMENGYSLRDSVRVYNTLLIQLIAESVSIEVEAAKIFNLTMSNSDLFIWMSCRMGTDALVIHWAIQLQSSEKAALSLFKLSAVHVDVANKALKAANDLIIPEFLLGGNTT